MTATTWEQFVGRGQGNHVRCNHDWPIDGTAPQTSIGIHRIHRCQRARGHFGACRCKVCGKPAPRPVSPVGDTEQKENRGA